MSIIGHGYDCACEECGTSPSSTPDDVLYDALRGLTGRVVFARATNARLTLKEYELLGALAIWWQTEGRFTPAEKGSSRGVVTVVHGPLPLESNAGGGGGGNASMIEETWCEICKRWVLSPHGEHCPPVTEDPT